MRLAVTGCQMVGKSTLVETIKAYWPVFKSPEKTYREVAKEKNLTLNEEGSLESQKVIRDFLVDLALDNAGKSHTIHDRCVLDNLVYSLWLEEHGKLGKDSADFITSSILLNKECMKFYDIIFWLPLNPDIPIEEKDQRSNSLIYREEIDNIFQAIYEEYKKNSNLFFERDNQPAFIVLEGNLDQKIDTIKQYIDDEGNLIDTKQSVLGDLESVYDEVMLKKQFGIK